MNVQNSFRALFGRPPEVVGQAPGRVNLMGDHTDYNNGYVLPAAIPQETTVEIARGKDKHHAYSATLDRHVKFDMKTGELSDFARYVGGCFRVLEKRGVIIPPLDIRVSSDVPVGAGLSSSAALEVATLRALNSLLGLHLDPIEIAKLAQYAEIDYAGVACGIMDQMASSLASPSRMLFLDTRSLERCLVPLPAGAEILVVDSGVPRELAASAYNCRRRECEMAAAALKVSSLRDVKSQAVVENLPSPLKERARHVVTENARVLAALKADAPTFGALMNESHASLRDDYEVSVAPVDTLVAWLQAQPEVFGARMTGAGFGGACVALVTAGQSDQIARRLMQADLEGSPDRQIVVPRL